jgi:hypothetical protein
MNKIKLVGKKGPELWYPKYAPHIILGTNKSILDYIYYRKNILKSSKLVELLRKQTKSCKTENGTETVCFELIRINKY